MAGLSFEEYVYLSQRVPKRVARAPTTDALPELVPLHRAEIGSLSGGPVLVWSYPTRLVPGSELVLDVEPGSLAGYRVPAGTTAYYESGARSLVLPGRGRMRAVRVAGGDKGSRTRIRVDAPCWGTFIWFKPRSGRARALLPLPPLPERPQRALAAVQAVQGTYA
jgi:hypothetical protein